MPNWRVFHAEEASTSTSLARLIRMRKCRYLFVPPDRDLGEIACATKAVADGWVLYQEIK